MQQPLSGDNLHGLLWDDHADFLENLVWLRQELLLIDENLQIDTDINCNPDLTSLTTD